MITEELSGSERGSVKMIVKILSIIEYHLCENYNIGIENYRGPNCIIRGTSQGNIISYTIWKDISYLFLRL